ncbi:hypothetical protein BJX76DRAFT_356288 [Aspergillus varians]
MATVAEQLFLFGEVLEPEPLTGVLAVLEYADLMLAGSLTFALIIILTIIAACWESITPMAVREAKQLPRAIAGPVLKVGWLLKQLLSVRSYTELDTLLYKVKAMMVMAILQGLPGRFLSAMGGWYFPFNRPQLTIIRLGCTFIGYMIVDSFLLSSLSLYLIIIRNALSDLVPSTKSYSLDTPADILHLEAIAFVAILFSLVAFLWFLFETASNAFTSHKLFTKFSSTPTKGNDARETIVSIPTPQAETDLRNTIRNCEAALKRERATVKAANKRIEEIWSRYKKEIASRNAAEESQIRASAEKYKLRQDIAQRDYQLQMTRDRFRENEHQHDIKIQKLQTRITQLEGSLEDQIEDSAQVEKDFKFKLAELEGRLDKTQTEQALAGQIAELQVQLENKAMMEENFSNKITQREAQLMKQLEQQTQTGEGLRHQLVLLEENFERELDASQIQLRQEAAQGLSRLQQLCAEQEAEIQRLVSAKIESDRQVEGLHDHVRGLQAEIVGTANEVKEKEGEIAKLQLELELFQDFQKEELPLLAQAQPTNADPQRDAMQQLINGYEAVLEQERNEANTVRRLVGELEKEVRDNLRRINMSMKDAERSHQEAIKARQRVNELEMQLTTPDDQIIPQKKMTDMKSVSTKLEKSQLTVVKQTHTISELQRQLAQVQEAGGAPGKAREIERLHVALRNEEVRRKTSEVQLQGANTKLFAENNSLKMKLSETEKDLREARAAKASPGPKGDPLVRVRK